MPNVLYIVVLDMPTRESNKKQLPTTTKYIYFKNTGYLSNKRSVRGHVIVFCPMRGQYEVT